MVFAGILLIAGGCLVVLREWKRERHENRRAQLARTLNWQPPKQQRSLAATA